MKIRDTITSISGYELSGPVVQTIKMLEELVERYGPTLELDYGNDLYDNTYTFDAHITREETPAEKKRRLAEKRDAEKRVLDRKRVMYEKLKREFGNKD